MKTQLRALAVVTLTAGLLLLFSSSSATQTTSNATKSQRVTRKDKKETTAMKHASGTFEVKLTPQAPDEKGSAVVGMMSIAKLFSGDLEGTSKGQMLAIGTEVEGSAGYVAMERVNGTLAGRTGTFALQHSGTMNRGNPELSVTVVPDSGTGELAGLSGKMSIKIEGKKHFYEFDYTLPKP